MTFSFYSFASFQEIMRLYYADHFDNEIQHYFWTHFAESPAASHPVFLRFLFFYEEAKNHLKIQEALLINSFEIARENLSQISPMERIHVFFGLMLNPFRGYHMSDRGKIFFDVTPVFSFEKFLEELTRRGFFENFQEKDWAYLFWVALFEFPCSRSVQTYFRWSEEDFEFLKMIIRLSQPNDVSALLDRWAVRFFPIFKDPTLSFAMEKKIHSKVSSTIQWDLLEISIEEWRFRFWIQYLAQEGQINLLSNHLLKGISKVDPNLWDDPKKDPFAKGTTSFNQFFMKIPYLIQKPLLHSKPKEWSLCYRLDFFFKTSLWSPSLALTKLPSRFKEVFESQVVNAYQLGSYSSQQKDFSILKRKHDEISSFFSKYDQKKRTLVKMNLLEKIPNSLVQVILHYCERSKNSSAFESLEDSSLCEKEQEKDE